MTGDTRRYERLRWRCRRGMLENDLVLARFLDAEEARLTDDDVAQLDALLDLSDNALWDLIAGRAEPADPRGRSLVERLRSV
ncbi:MAG: FAD assembly factor SdhE [Casimicrobiaceae bacterium]